jgi:outer membrane protein assembly factor BamB
MVGTTIRITFAILSCPNNRRQLRCKTRRAALHCGLSSPSAKPAAVYYSKSDKLLYVFGYNPGKVISLKPDDGSIAVEVNLDDSSGVGVMKSVVVHELESHMDFVIVTIDNETDSGNTSVSRLICWDFSLRIIRWQYDVADAGLKLPLVGNSVLSDDGQMVFQHFRGERFMPSTRHRGSTWSSNFFPMAGWTYLNGLLYAGILSENGGIFSPVSYCVNALTGDLVERYQAPNPCLSLESTYLASNSRAMKQTVLQENCNNIWTSLVPSISGKFLYVLDDLFGLMKFYADNTAGPDLERNVFSLDTTQTSQQTYRSPVVSPDDRVVYASAYWTTVAINANDGTTIWTVSQGNNWLSNEMIVSPYGDAIFSPFNLSVHKIDTSSGEIEFETDTNRHNTLVGFNDASIMFTAGVDLQAYETKVSRGISLANSGAPGGYGQSHRSSDCTCQSHYSSVVPPVNVKCRLSSH